MPAKTKSDLLAEIRSLQDQRNRLRSACESVIRWWEDDNRNLTEGRKFQLAANAARGGLQDVRRMIEASESNGSKEGSVVENA